jgi:hypothetical protein
MIEFKKAVLRALGAALPVELVNFFVFMPPIDVGIPDDAPFYTKLLGFQWAVLHYPGLRLTSQLDPYGKAFPPFFWLLGGYVDTALLILACILAFHGMRRFIGPRIDEPPPQRPISP